MIADTKPEGKEDKEKISYRIKIKYPLGLYSVYQFNEITDVKRIYSDSSTKEYKRIVTYFFTFFIADKPEGDFQKIRVSCDSMIYSFTDGRKSFYFNSQSDSLPKENFNDFNYNAIPLARDFEITYSPYYDVAKIESQEYETLKKQILVQGKEKLDTLNRFVWLNTISDDNLKYFTDMLKGIVPYNFVISDSVWKSPFIIKLDAIYFNDTASVRIAEYRAGNFTLECNTENLKPNPQIARLYDINRLVDINSGKGNGYYILKIDPNGMVESAESEFNADITASIRKETFWQNIKSKIEWKRINQYTFK